MTNIKTTHAAAPDESGRASRLITQAIYLDGDVITHVTARLIAAAIHPGPGSALERLAASGQFDAAVLRRELNDLSLEPFQRPWRDAVLTYLDAVRVDHPWTRPVIIPRDLRRRPRPTGLDGDPRQD